MKKIKIKQELISVYYEDIKVHRLKNIQKYHITRKGTARKNPEFERYKHIPNAHIKTTDKFDIEVKRIAGGEE